MRKKIAAILAMMMLLNVSSIVAYADETELETSVTKQEVEKTLENSLQTEEGDVQSTETEIEAFNEETELKEWLFNGVETLPDDPEYQNILEEGREELNRPNLFAFSYGGYNHNDRFSGSTVRNGIDVSYYQGNIDWNAVRNSGIEFAFIRVGYRGYSNGTLKADPNVTANLQGAINAGLKVGAYIFSQAINTAEAEEEARFALSQVSGYNITMPIVIDYEYVSNGTGRLYQAHLSREQATANVNAFCAAVKNNSGYEPMIYANKNMLETAMYAENIPYKVWLANYTSETSYQGNYEFWQYTSSGNVAGISGRVDQDFWYDGVSNYKASDYAAVYDYNYYVTHNTDVAAVFGYDETAVLRHFVDNGMAEGRQANAEFNVYAYKGRYLDLAASYGNDLKAYYMHYINFGKNEGRIATEGNGEVSKKGITVFNGVDYASVYNFEYYLSQNPDVQAAFGNDDAAVIKQFVNYGMAEGRQGSEEFNAFTYKNRYQDVRSAYGSDLKAYYTHYLNYGKKEGRSGAGTADIVGGVTGYNGVDYSPVYDFNYYINQNPDVKSAFGNDDTAALRHFVEYGMAEGRQALEDFNVITYRNRYADVRSVYGNDLRAYYVHYMNYGRQEGRSGSGTSDVTSTITSYNGVDYSLVYDYNFYTAQNPDVKAVYGDDDAATLQHFVNYGMAEGRQAREDFNVFVYKNRYQDVAAVFGDDLKGCYLHYMQHGRAEGRTGDGELVDVPSNGANSAGTVYDGVDYSSVYNFDYYLNANADVAEAFGNDAAAVLKQFVDHGMAEGRQGSVEFNVYTYMSKYGDLQSAYGSDLMSYYMHYVQYGKNEGRTGTE